MERPGPALKGIERNRIDLPGSKNSLGKNRIAIEVAVIRIQDNRDSVRDAAERLMHQLYPCHPQEPVKFRVEFERADRIRCVSN